MNRITNLSCCFITEFSIQKKKNDAYYLLCHLYLFFNMGIFLFRMGCDKVRVSLSLEETGPCVQRAEKCLGAGGQNKVIIILERGAL